MENNNSLVVLTENTGISVFQYFRFGPPLNCCFPYGNSVKPHKFSLEFERVCGFTEWLFCKTTYLLTWICKGIWYYILTRVCGFTGYMILMVLLYFGTKYKLRDLVKKFFFSEIVSYIMISYFLCMLYVIEGREL